MDRTLSVATTPNQNEAGSDVNEEVLHITQSSSMTIRLFSVISKTLFVGGSYPATKMQSVYPAAPAYWTLWIFIRI